MPAKRTGSRPSAAAASSSPVSNPLANALLLAAAFGIGLATLVSKGRLSWPPHQLLASTYTVAGCLAMVGPLVLARVDSSERGLGDLLWMTGGLLIWIFDGAAAARGLWQSQPWATPLGYETMGLTMLAVLVAGWRCKLGARHWAWTNVTGWLLGIFWVAMAITTLVPARITGLALR